MILLKKMLVAVAGGALLLVGVAMLVLPGPAIVVIPAALAILAVEFVWAGRWLNCLRERSSNFSWRTNTSCLTKLNPDKQ
jgi:tellurite resistance protein TerC